MRPAAHVIIEKFGVDLERRRTATTRNQKGGFLLVSALKPGGEKFLLLPVMDPKMFPPFVRHTRAEYISKWGKSYGKKQFHVNPDPAALEKVCSDLGSVAYLEAPACLYCIKDSVVESLEKSSKRRESSLAASVLDDF
ncbi:hypothetical protein LJR143_001168 [Pseudoxanthomonas sp. LjRoot143]|uniref:hypothetical protein n=1 Tax=Pseudoxanthomonas sp. LjRoot143 TaxID=3342266 RepID=UPI003ECFEDC2